MSFLIDVPGTIDARDSAEHIRGRVHTAVESHEEWNPSTQPALEATVEAAAYAIETLARKRVFGGHGFTASISGHVNQSHDHEYGANSLAVTVTSVPPKAKAVPETAPETE